MEHRPWLPPDGPWLLSQSWNDALFAHFPVQKEALRRMVPEGLTLDLYDGWGWVTVAAFCVSHVRPSGVPALPGLSFFPVVSLRTCVSLGGKPGLYNLSADAANLSAVWFARMFFRMQYWHAKIEISGGTIQSRKAQEKAIRVHSTRLHGPAASDGKAMFEASYEPVGEAMRVGRGSVEEFLMERYCVYSGNIDPEKKRKVYRTEVHHQPWAMQRAEVEIAKITLGDPLGLWLGERPQVCCFSRSQKMLIWAPERVREK